MSRYSHEIVLGIDFGTTYSAAAAVVEGQMEWVLLDGDTSIPTVVHVPKRGEMLVGRPALMRMATDPAATIPSIKRLLGRTMDDPEVKATDASSYYKLSEGPGQGVLLTIGEQVIACEQLAGKILDHLRRAAERRFGSSISRAVIGAPVRCPPGYIEALQRAARLAHLEIVSVVAEPVAAAHSLGIAQEPDARRLAVVDFGGGTLDVSVLFQNGEELKPVACGGDGFLGGDDFDSALCEAVAGAVFRQARFDMHRDVVRWRRLMFAVEAVKRALSHRAEAPLRVRDAYIENGRRADIDVVIDRAWAESHWRKLVTRATEVVRSVAEPIHQTGPIDEIYLVGGTGLIPMVKRALKQICSAPLRTHERADLAVVTGLAMHGSRYARRQEEVAVYR